DRFVRADLHLVRQPAEDGVVLEQVPDRAHVAEVVERDDLHVGAGGEQRPEEVPPDPTEAVDSHPNSHKISLPRIGEPPGGSNSRPASPQTVTVEPASSPNSLNFIGSGHPAPAHPPPPPPRAPPPAPP